MSAIRRQGDPLRSVVLYAPRYPANDVARPIEDEQLPRLVANQEVARRNQRAPM